MRPRRHLHRQPAVARAPANALRRLALRRAAATSRPTVAPATAPASAPAGRPPTAADVMPPAGAPPEARPGAAAPTSARRLLRTAGERQSATSVPCAPAPATASPAPGVGASAHVWLSSPPRTELRSRCIAACSARRLCLRCRPCADRNVCVGLRRWLPRSCIWCRAGARDDSVPRSEVQRRARRRHRRLHRPHGGCDRASRLGVQRVPLPRRRRGAAKAASAPSKSAAQVLRNRSSSEPPSPETVSRARHRRGRSPWFSRGGRSCALALGVVVLIAVVWGGIRLFGGEPGLGAVPPRWRARAPIASGGRAVSSRRPPREAEHCAASSRAGAQRRATRRRRCNAKRAGERESGR